MTVVRGRARSGAGSVVRAALCCAFSILALTSSGCGKSTISYGTNLITFSATATPGTFATYLVYVAAITLTRTDGTVVEPMAIEERVDFTKLSDVSELFGAPAVVEGTYTKATITMDYTSAVIAVIFGGKTARATVNNSAGKPATAVTWTATFDPNHPLVIKHGVTTPMNLNFDLPASTVISNSTTAPIVVVRPVLTVNTAPVYTKPIRARGLFVTAESGSTTNFVINTRSFFDVSSNPFGALEVITTPQTTYDVDGVQYTGAAGLGAIQALQINTTVAAYGTITSLNGVTPTLTATAVYAGTSQDSPLEDRVTGTVTSRNGNTLNVHGALVASRVAQEDFEIDLPVLLDSSTIVSIDGQPAAKNLSAASISIGQQVNIAGGLTLNTTTGALVNIDATHGGLARLTPTSAWGVVTNYTTGSVTLDLVTLGGYPPSQMTFTGTGTSTATNSNPAAYSVDTGTLNLGSITTGMLVRVDGTVAPLGTAPPDFNATAITPASATDQILEIEWNGTGSKAPFVTLSATGTVINMSDPQLGFAHYVQIGPTTIDLTDPRVNVTLVGAASSATNLNSFAFGNPTTTTGMNSYNQFSDLITHVHSQLNGTNSLQKLVAVGTYDEASSTFTAKQVDIVQYQ